MAFKNELPFTNLVVARVMEKGKFGSRERLRKAAISRKVSPPTTKSSMDFFLPESSNSGLSKYGISYGLGKVDGGLFVVPIAAPPMLEDDDAVATV
jgi:hypothetical protein